MAQAVSTSITRRSAVAGLALAAAPMTVLATADNAHAQAKQTMPEKSLYERLGGVFAIAGGGRPLQRRRREEPHRRPDVQEPAATGMAYQ